MLCVIRQHSVMGRRGGCEACSPTGVSCAPLTLCRSARTVQAALTSTSRASLWTALYFSNSPESTESYARPRISGDCWTSSEGPVSESRCCLLLSVHYRAAAHGASRPPAVSVSVRLACEDCTPTELRIRLAWVAPALPCRVLLAPSSHCFMTWVLNLLRYVWHRVNPCE